jgi:phosphatidylinositol glycan class N
VFVASLEGVSELFISGVEVEDDSAQMAREKELGAVVMTGTGTNGSAVRGKTETGNGKASMEL